jgi:hypothetical protein
LLYSEYVAMSFNFYFFKNDVILYTINLNIELIVHLKEREREREREPKFQVNVAYNVQLIAHRHVWCCWVPKSLALFWIRGEGYGPSRNLLD